MHFLDHELWGVWGFALFYLAGLPIAWHFVRQQGMVESSKQDGHRVVKVLAIMWPVLLFAMWMNQFQPKKSELKGEDCDRKLPVKDLLDKDLLNVDNIEVPSATEICDGEFL